jgi:hypothetical protein
MTGYLECDSRIIDFITDLKISIAKQGKRRILKTKELIDQGDMNKTLFNLDESEKEELFDMIAKEFPDL